MNNLVAQPVALPPVGGAFIDYISVTKSAGELYPWNEENPFVTALDAFPVCGFGSPFDEWVKINGFTEERGAHGFTHAYVFLEGGARVQRGHTSGRVQVVLSGRGCEMMTDLNDLYKMDLWAGVWAQGDAIRVTRLDIARDFATDLYPDALLPYIAGGRGRTSGLITSDTGQTASFGSRSSDKYLRVYRYNPPHPRAGTLRFEWEIKGAACVQAHKLLIEGVSVDEIMAGLMLDFLSGSSSAHPSMMPLPPCG